MSLATSFLRAAQRTVSRAHSRAGEPFDPSTPFHPPRGRHSTVHYGLMFPNLPAPLNFLDVITVIGQPAVKLWSNDHLIETSAADTACLLVGSAVTFPGQFSGYRVGRDLRLAPDSSVVRFGDDFVLEGRYPEFHVAYRNPAFEVDLDIYATDKVAHFAKLHANLYDHWSLLCTYQGKVTHSGGSLDLEGLSTLEYARAARLNLGLTFFTYQILTIDARTQVLMVEVRGALGVPMQQAVYVRGIDDYGGFYEDGFRYEIQELEAQPRRTPNGRSMSLASRFGWRVDDSDGTELISIEAVGNDDYVYGMTGGYVGSYRYTGRFRGEAIAGTGYVEHIGTRPPTTEG